MFAGVSARPAFVGRPARFLSLLALALGTACGADAASDPAERAVVEQYVSVVRATYDDALSTARTLETKIDRLVDAPSQASLNAAREAWLAAREPYGQSEAFRFYEGPIDDPKTGPEGRINGWPLDEVFIDYVSEDAKSGIINHPDLFPTLTKELIAEQNERGGEKNISSGYHAIEFLLWGQDLSATGPGKRPYTDYVVGAETPNAKRRAQYLSLTADLLSDDLTEIDTAWNDDADSYANELLALAPRDAIKRMLKGLSGLTGEELPGERMMTAYLSGEQEDEHSCFSDNTLRDFATNLIGIENVYLGRYGKDDGAGIDELVAKLDKDLDQQMKADIEAAKDAVDTIPAPLDQALLGLDGAEGRKRFKAAIDAIKQVNLTLVEVVETLDL